MIQTSRVSDSLHFHLEVGLVGSNTKNGRIEIDEINLINRGEEALGERVAL